MHVGFFTSTGHDSIVHIVDWLQFKTSEFLLSVITIDVNKGVYVTEPKNEIFILWHFFNDLKYIYIYIYIYIYVYI